FVKSSLSTHVELDIFLMNKQIIESSAKKLSQAISKCNNLQKLSIYLNFNQIQNTGLSTLASALTQISNLSEFSIYLELLLFLLHKNQSQSKQYSL
ncbi:hypothetical protein ABPG74_011456, partial [Tetrahymena malaccensis]